MCTHSTCMKICTYPQFTSHTHNSQVNNNQEVMLPCVRIDINVHCGRCENLYEDSAPPVNASSDSSLYGRKSAGIIIYNRTNHPVTFSKNESHWGGDKVIQPRAHFKDGTTTTTVYTLKGKNAVSVTGVRSPHLKRFTASGSCANYVYLEDYNEDTGLPSTIKCSLTKL